MWDAIVIQKPATSVLSRMGRCTPRDMPLVCSSADQAKGASPCKVGDLGETPTAATQKPRMSVVSRMGRCTPRDLPLVCSSADQAKGASPCKVGGLVETQTPQIIVPDDGNSGRMSDWFIDTCGSYFHCF